MGFQCGGGLSVFVGREVVADHDSPRFDLRYKNFADVGCEGLPVHCAFDDPRSNQAIVGQASDEGLGSPGTEGSRSVEPGSALRSPAQPCHVRFDAGLIDKDNTMRSLCNGWQRPAEPVAPRLPYMGFAPLIRDEALFLYVRSSRRNTTSMPDSDA